MELSKYTESSDKLENFVHEEYLKHFINKIFAVLLFMGVQFLYDSYFFNENVNNIGPLNITKSHFWKESDGTCHSSCVDLNLRKEPRSDVSRR